MSANPMVGAPPGRSGSPGSAGGGQPHPRNNRAKLAMRTTRWVLALVLTAVALGTVAWLVTSVNELHDRLARHSEPLALVFVGTAALVALASALAAVRMFWKLGRTPRDPA